MSGLRFEALADRPDLRAGYRELARLWPRFMLEDPVADRHWTGMHERFPGYQLVVLDADTGGLVGRALTLPCYWDGTIGGLPAGWDGAIEAAMAADAPVPNCLAALEVSLRPTHRGGGASAEVLGAMRGIARARGLGAFIAPVRPSLKHRYPLTPIDRYAWWTRDDGLPFDPWMRVHARVGATVLTPADPSMRIEGSIADWEGWTGMRFPESGDYVVPDALVPIHMDLEANRGTYLEPNVWMCHRLE